MNVEYLTLKQIREILALLPDLDNPHNKHPMVGKKCIIRTYSAGVWYGELENKAGREVILKNARRMWRWWAKTSISLSACALYGIKHDKSSIAQAVPHVWLEAIEIIPCLEESIQSIEGCPNAIAE